MALADTLGQAAARSADLGHGSLQLPLRHCTPREVFGRDYEFLERAELLTFEEIERLVRIFVGEHGVTKIRLTGGEPLLRREVERPVGQLARIPGLGDLAMTSNGSALARKAQALKDAGLRRITVSLDGLDNEAFVGLNDVGFAVDRVLAGIEAAAAARHGPIKIDSVASTMTMWCRWPAISAAAAMSCVIASVTRPPCGGCTRARLSADGKLFTCLFAIKGHDLRALLRDGASDVEISASIGRIWRVRDDRYSELRTAETAALPKVEMSYIGG